jgi:hypothetical protein
MNPLLIREGRALAPSAMFVGRPSAAASDAPLREVPPGFCQCPDTALRAPMDAQKVRRGEPFTVAAAAISAVGSHQVAGSRTHI